MELRNRATGFVKALPPGQRVVIVSALAAVAMLGVVFLRWVTTPTYTVLYSGLDDTQVQDVVDGIEAQGVPYKLEAAGSRILVPQEDLYTTRAALAKNGVEAGAVTPPGYELLDEQGISVSDFRQKVDYQRALEGELSKTLMAMDAIDTATVRLVLPEEELFVDEQSPVTASVLLGTSRELSATEVETVTSLVSSSVEGLQAKDVTVADTAGTVLQAAGDGGVGSVTNKNMRSTREFEQALAADVTTLLSRFGGGPASVVVRATLDFDETERNSVTRNPDSQTPSAETTETETFAGAGTMPGGTVGVDGGPLPEGGEETNYESEKRTTEYVIDEVSERTITSPGRVEKMSVAIVTDDGSLTGASVPTAAEVERLVTAALGLEADRGDTVAVTAVPFPAVEAEESEPEADVAVTDLIGQIIAAVVLLIVCIALFLMTRRRKPAGELVEAPAALPAVEADPPQPLPERIDNSLSTEVAHLVKEQPEEIAMLLRSWLADRRS